MSLDTIGALKYISSEMRDILILKFPYKNTRELESLVRVYSKQFLSKCINIAIMEKIHDSKEIKALIKDSIASAFDKIDESGKFFNFDFFGKIIKEVATGGREDASEQEALKTYEFLEPKLLYLVSDYNYALDNGVLGAVIKQIGGFNTISARVVIGGMPNRFNSFALKEFKAEFLRRYKKMKFAIEKGEVEPVFMLENSRGKRYLAITKTLEQKIVSVKNRLESKKVMMIES